MDAGFYGSRVIRFLDERGLPVRPRGAGQPAAETLRPRVSLFKDRRYAYHVFVTTLSLSPWRVYLFYVKLPYDYHSRREFQNAVRDLHRLRLPTQFRFCKSLIAPLRRARDQ